MASATGLARDPSAIGQTIRELREDKGLYINELADQVGITPEWLGRVENGQAASGAMYGRIANALGVSRKQILEGDVE